MPVRSNRIVFLIHALVSDHAAVDLFHRSLQGLHAGVVDQGLAAADDLTAALGGLHHQGVAGIGMLEQLQDEMYDFFILSRQNVNNLPAGTDYEQARKGAYIVTGSDEDYDVIMVASGSEVSTLVAGAELLRQEGIKTRIVSVPSEGVFRTQPIEYQQSIIPMGSKVFGLTAGLPVNLQGFLIGAQPESRIWGLDSFGFSAPYKVLDEKLGYTAQNVYEQVKAMLS